METNNNSKKYEWVAFYESLATKLLDYKNNRKELIEKLQNINSIKFSRLERNGKVIDIDPFTVFGLFNTYMDDTKRETNLKGIATEFGIKEAVPSTFYGVVQLLSLNSTFINFNSEHKENDIDNLWNIYETAIQYANSPSPTIRKKLESQFDIVVKQKGICWNITMGLYWIRPNNYINLSSNSRDYLTTEGITLPKTRNKINELKKITGKQYLWLCDDIKKKIDSKQSTYHSFPDLSHVAYNYNTKSVDKSSSEDTLKENNMNPKSITDISKNTILYGPPGTGKTYNTILYAVAICKGWSKADVNDINLKPEKYKEVKDCFDELRKNNRIAFTTFHQSYGYEEFIEGIRPVMPSKDETNSDNKEIEQLKYRIDPGVFKQFCEQNKESKEPCVFIIDEINRGNISKIFGELITLIEDTKRKGMWEQTSAILPYSGKEFSVPSNVYILGTMNTADRSIALMDTALRRRFNFIEMMPNTSLLDFEIKQNGVSVNIGKMLDKINERIEFLFDREHTIGHAFFMKLKKNPDIDVLADIFKCSVIPLLQEYFYEDYKKIQLVLGDNEKEKGFKFIQEELVKPSSLFRGRNQLEESYKYTINEEAFMKIRSYIGILNPDDNARKENEG